ncbi:hypothetical protein A3F05_03815 [Candidatus Saccharibacteria bacterium RIFCSPHIGHO2_12_FULL_47_17]|nr:MAG: hypothetical protein A3F05_03815 [Candidatus Saccharibacteria bacterium RIFCSPHIGHO2_12_FULL_47_17]
MAARYLITGVAGTGKSTVAHQLHKRGYAAYDADSGFSYYVNKKTRQRVPHPKTPSLEWYAKHERIFDENVLQDLFQKHTGEQLFLASITANQSKYYPKFDKIFLLTANDKLLAHRLKSRTTSDFGKHPVDLHRVLSGRPDFDAELRAAGAIEIDSSKSIETVVGQILDHLNESL